MKAFLKKGISFGLYTLGRSFSAGQIPVLTYHSVDNSCSIISVSPSIFERQMQYLAEEGYKTISLKKYCRYLETGRGGDEREIVITFDDGFRNNFETAFPVLRRFGFTATIFLTAGFMEQTSGWQVHKSIPGMPLMLWNEAREMLKNGMEFGAHTVTHPDLVMLNEKEAEKEITASKKMIEEKLESQVDFFCYPYGRYNDRILKMVKNAGFSGACTINYGINRCVDAEKKYEIKRIGTSYFKTLTDFKAGVTGTYGIYLAFLKMLKK